DVLLSAHSEVWFVFPDRIGRRLKCSGMLLPFLVLVGFWVVSGGSLSGQTGYAQVGGSNSLGNTSMPGATAVPPNTVQGEVINASTGAPVPRALVRLNNRAVLPDQDGNFRL